MHLDLEPFTGAVLLIRGIGVLRDLAFQVPALGNAVSGTAILRQTTRKEDLIRRLSEGGFRLVPAVRKRIGAKI